jgi:hypothetical protein
MQSAARLVAVNVPQNQSSGRDQLQLADGQSGSCTGSIVAS